MMKKQIISGIIIGLLISIIIQHLLYGNDLDYNIFYQLGRLFNGK